MLVVRLESHILNRYSYALSVELAAFANFEVIYVLGILANSKELLLGEGLPLVKNLQRQDDGLDEAYVEKISVNHAGKELPYLLESN